MSSRSLVYKTERGRNTATYAAWFDECSREQRPFIIVSDYRHAGTMRANLTVDMVTAGEPMDDEALRWFHRLVAEHRWPQGRAYVGSVRTDIYELTPELAHRLAMHVARWTGGPL